MDVKTREKLRRNLKRHRGAIKEVAQLAGVRREFVYMVLKGKRTSLRVLEASSSVLLKRESIRKERLNNVRINIRKAESIAV